MGNPKPATGQQAAGQQPTDTATGTDAARQDTPNMHAELAKWKDLARKNEARAKANAAAAAKLAQIEESGKTEQQKLADRLTQAEQRAAAAETRLLATEVAAATGLPAAFAARLRGTSREELEADAADLLSALPDAPTNSASKIPPVDAVAGTGSGNSPRSAADEFASFLGG